VVQTNFGGDLMINGAPVGRELGEYYYKRELSPPAVPVDPDDGSIMVVVATDAPLTAVNLERLAKRAMIGIGRTGSFITNGSGDYVISFSTHPGVRRPRVSRDAIVTPALVNSSMTPLFAATVEATQESIYNALFKATTVESSRGISHAIDIDSVIEILNKYNALNWDKSISP